jgi:hypothetical protein
VYVPAKWWWACRLLLLLSCLGTFCFAFDHEDGGYIFILIFWLFSELHGSITHHSHRFDDFNRNIRSVVPEFYAVRWSDRQPDWYGIGANVDLCLRPIIMTAGWTLSPPHRASATGPNMFSAVNDIQPAFTRYYQNAQVWLIIFLASYTVLLIINK